MDVANIRNAAACDHRDGDRLRQRHGRGDVAAIEQPVAPDVGEQQRGDAGILEAPRQILDAHVGDIRPAFGRDHAIARIDADDDPARQVARGRFDEIGVFERGGADDDALHPEREPAIDARAIADTAADLHPARKGRDDAFDRRAVDAFTGEGAVEINDVQMAGARVREQPRLRRRIVAIDGCARHIAFGEPHHLPALEVDRGEDDQGRHARNLSRVARP